MGKIERFLKWYREPALGMPNKYIFWMGIAALIAFAAKVVEVIQYD